MRVVQGAHELDALLRPRKPAWRFPDAPAPRSTGPAGGALIDLEPQWALVRPRASGTPLFTMPQERSAMIIR
jgi:hypothetical protein